MALRSVIKSDGDPQAFSKQKLLRSMRRAGATKNVAEEIVQKVKKSPEEVTTEKIHQTVYRELLHKERPLAARYNLKRALSALGPSGYPFEQFVARLLDAKGYEVTTNRIIRGKCVSHEIDVLGKKDDRHFVFECKFHNRSGFKSDIQTVLYMKARYDDIRLQWERTESKKKKHLHHVWIVTNTQFTSEARKYARCAGVGLMSWRSPAGHSLAEMIEEVGLHPVTAITSLSVRQKDYLVSHGLVLCREIAQKKHVLKRAGIRGHKMERIIKEAREICGR